jgi:hypothetical protein
MVVLQRNPQLLHVVPTLRPTGRFARRLNGREQQCDQDADDGDNHQQLDQRKADSPLNSHAITL